MAAVLRQCPRCHLVFEGGNTCPTCRRDITTLEPSKAGKLSERRKTGEVPRVTRVPKGK